MGQAPCSKLRVYTIGWEICQIGILEDRPAQSKDRLLEPCGSAMAMTLTESGGDPVVTNNSYAGTRRIGMDQEGVLQYLMAGHGGWP